MRAGRGGARYFEIAKIAVRFIEAEISFKYGLSVASLRFKW